VGIGGVIYAFAWIFSIIAAVKAGSGQPFRYPLTWRLVRQADRRRARSWRQRGRRSAAGPGHGPAAVASVPALGARDGVTVRGRARMLAMPARSAAPGPPRPVGFRDGQICRWDRERRPPS
jgi:uncharacterized protein DUF4870